MPGVKGSSRFVVARKLLKGMGNIGNYRDYMNSSAHLAVRKTKTQKKRGRPRSAKTSPHSYDTTMAAAGTLTRTKALLLAALRVWELKHRIHE